MAHLLVVSDKMFPGGATSRLESGYASIYFRNQELDLASYYQSVLEWLTQGKREYPEACVTLVETGPRLEAGTEEGPLSVYLITDIVGLMLQPSCRTEDAQGQVQFTGVARLFAPDLLDTTEELLRTSGMEVSRVTAAAVAAPELLTDAERKVLRGMGAGVAVTYLYLEARAARARNVPALGVVLPGGRPAPPGREGEATWVEILCRLVGGR